MPVDRAVPQGLRGGRKEGGFTRRALLKAAVSALAVSMSRGVRALGAGSRFDVAEIMLPSGTTSRPAAWQRLLYEVIQSTSIECDPKAIQLAPDDPKLFEHPFSVLIGDGPLPELSEKAIQQLVRYLSYGGFLLVDDTTGELGGGFYKSVWRVSNRMFPTRPLAPLPADHSVYRSFFLLDRPVGRLALSSTLEGVSLGAITPLIYCPDDLSGALDRGPDGRDRYPVVPGGAEQRREALKLGINLVLYSLTSNYKHDQAHVMELIREGRLE